MSKELFISSSPHETKVAVLEDDQLVEVYYERQGDMGLAGSIYKGRVSRVLPGMQSAFVDIGLERDAFLYVSDFYEDEEEYDRVFSEAEARASRFVGGLPAAASERSVALAEGERPAVPGAETASHPVAGAASAPAEGAPVTGAGAGAAAPPHVGAEPPEYRRHEARGRRRRRRSRSHAEPRFAPRPDHRERAFEVLPGESLAKYSQATPETPSPETTARTPTEAEAGQAAPELAEEPPPDQQGAAPEHTVAQSAEVATGHGEESSDTVRISEPAPPESDAAAGALTGFAVSSPEAASKETEAPVIPSAREESGGLTEPASESSSAPASRNGDLIESPSRPTLESPEEVQPPFNAQEKPLGRAEEDGPAEAPVTAEHDERADAALDAGSERASAATSEEGQAAGEGFEPETEEAVEPAALAESEAPAEDQPAGPGAEDHAQAAGEPATGAAGVPKEQFEGRYTLREPHQRPRFAPRRRRGRRGMGRRGQAERVEPSRPGNSQPVQIADVLKEGQEILVQIAKEPLGAKGARITSHIALPGRYLVYMPTISHIGVSRKITSEEERLRLRNLILENRGSLTGGFIVRTAGQGRAEEEFKADLKFLSTLWAEIRAKADHVKAPALIHRDLDLVERILRDILSPDFKTVRVDSELDYARVVEFAHHCQPSLAGRVKLYTRRTPIFEEFGIQAEIDKALKPKVWLKSGGYIVINQTEALVAIDVNTGKFVGKTKRLEDTIVKTNIDALNEIVRQVRLRDLGGIIVIDFIDMEERRNRQKVLQALEEALRRDRAPTKILSINEFGLVALTRKRVKQSLERTLCERCRYCEGSGWIKSVGTVCHEILGETRKMAAQIEGDTMTLRVNPEVAQALKSRQGALLSEMESLTHKDIIVKSDPTVHQEQFEIC